MENNNLEQLARRWMTTSPDEAGGQSDYYCQTRDVYQSRLDKMTLILTRKNIFKNNFEYLVSAIIGEVGNNSFDHNVGNWPNVTGIFFGFELGDKKIKIIIADRGLGLYTTLKKVKPSINNDQEAMQVAFVERISGRAPEPRGNGLKFVRENIKEAEMHLTFYSGTARGEFNDEMIITETSEKLNGCFAILTVNI